MTTHEHSVSNESGFPEVEVPLSISTQTEIAQTSMRCVSRDALGMLFNEVDVVDYDTCDAGVIKIRWSKYSKGKCKKDAVHARTYQHCFENQLSFYVRCLKSRSVKFVSMCDASMRFKKTFHDAVTKHGTACEVNYDIDANHVRVLLPPAVVQVRRVVFDACGRIDPRTTCVVAVCDGKSHDASVRVGSKDAQLVVGFDKIVTVHRSLVFVFFDTKCKTPGTLKSVPLVESLDARVCNVAELVYPHEISGFLFNSGKCKLAGTKVDGDSTYAVETFYNSIRDPSIYFGAASLQLIESLETVLINTDTNVPFKIDRMKLYKKLLTEYPNMNVFYDIDIHAAVKVRYFCNTAYDGQGQCKCCVYDSTMTSKCRGRGDASAVGRCKVVTNLIYSNGKIVSTGGRTMSQSRKSITFIRDMLLRYRRDIDVE